MSYSESVIVVVPGYPAELIQDLLNSRVLSHHKDHDVVLPPERTHRYDHLIEGRKFFRVRILPSPGRKFFSTPHLRWVREKLKSSENAVVLITKSPYYDFSIAVICLIVWLLSVKTITLLRTDRAAVNALPDSDINPNHPTLAERWLSLDLNLRTLWDDIYWHLHRRFYPKDPWNRWEILVLVMFVGLVIRGYLSNFFFSLINKLRRR
jgi:hypothetical protein